MYPKILPEVRGGAQRAEGSVVEGKLLYYCQKLSHRYLTSVYSEISVCKIFFVSQRRKGRKVFKQRIILIIHLVILEIRGDK